MSFGKSIGSLIIETIKAEKSKDCSMCIKFKTNNCPNSSKCYSTEDKPFFESKI